MRKMKIKERNERAQEVLLHFLDNMGYWREVEYLVKDLSEEELEQVDNRVVEITESIKKQFLQNNRYRIAETAGEGGRKMIKIMIQKETLISVVSSTVSFLIMLIGALTHTLYIVLLICMFLSLQMAIKYFLKGISIEKKAG